MHYVRRILLACLIVISVFAFLQRKLMYPASQATSLVVSNFPQLAENFHSASDEVLTTSDKVTIKGWHLQCGPENSDRLILLFHGNGGHRGGRGHWYTIAKSINADVLAIDYHGYGDSGGSPSESALISDAEAAWKHAVDALKYQPSQIVIVGESLGGGVSVQLAAAKCRQKTPPAGLVLSATFLSMVDVASRKFYWLPVRMILLDRYRSDQHIANVQCPILQFHGDSDTLVPLESAQKLHDLAPETSSNGTAKAIHVFAGAGHNDLLRQHGWTIRDHIGKFIR